MWPVLAAIPIVAVVMLMAVKGWSASRAGWVTAVGALGLGLGVFGRDGTATGVALVGILAESSFITLTIISIIGPALGLHLLQQHSGATGHLRSLLATLHPDERVGMLAVAWFFTLFLEGAAGFGTPVALAAPLLVSGGLTPVTALVAALLGHAAGVSFGAVGTPVLAQSSLVDIPPLDLARATVVLHLAVGWVLLAAVVALLRQGRPGLWGWGLGAGGAFFLPFGAIAATLGPELATLGGAVIGAAIWSFALVRYRRRRSVAVPPRPQWGRVARSMAPYATLIAMVALTRLVPPVRSFAENAAVEWDFEGFRGRVVPLIHPALLLSTAFVVAALVQHVPGREVMGSAVSATRRVIPVAVAVLAMVTIARTMSQTGMTAELAEAAVVVGAAWPLIAPAIGALGTFVTGSATASNLLFSELHLDTATRLGSSPTLVLGAQGFGAAIGNIVCPHNVVAAAATVGLGHQEGMVLRRTVPLAGLAVVLGGVVALILSAVVGT